MVALPGEEEVPLENASCCWRVVFLAGKVDSTGVTVVAVVVAVVVVTVVVVVAVVVVAVVVVSVVVVEVHTPHMIGHVVRTNAASCFDVHCTTLNTVPHTLCSLMP